MDNQIKMLLNSLAYRRLQWGISKAYDAFGKSFTYIPKEYAGKLLLDNAETTRIIMELLEADRPCMIARFGSNEINNIIEFEKKRLKISKKMSQKWLDKLYRNAGVFPASEIVAERFSKVMIDAASEVDLLGAWCRNCEDYILRTYMPDANITALKNLEPYYYENPWSQVLEGKKILVIHPFEETIRSQFNKREHLFKNARVLPQFELHTLKAVQSIAGNKPEEFDNWFEALEWMYYEAIKVDFDIAIIGCGAYGFPLAAKLKHYGKKAFHLGGATQLLFGIKGARWDNGYVGKNLYNEFWTRPLEMDVPQNIKKVENGCYW